MLANQLEPVHSDSPVLRSWSVKVKEEEFLPDEWHERVISRGSKGLMSPAVDHEPLKGRYDGQLQLGLCLL